MQDLLGLIAIFLVSLITLIVAFRFKKVKNIIIVALILRVFILLFGHYIAPLPDSTSDAVGFEITAWRLGQGSFLNILSQFSFDPFIFFSWLHAFPYSLFGRSILMAQSISLLFGIGTIFFGWRLANILWDNRTANKVGWTMALFPSLILYSVLLLREIYICFFLVLAIYGAVTWIKTDSFRSIVLSFVGFVGATLFHGAMFVGALVVVMIVTIKYLKNFIKLLINNKISIKNIILTSILVIILGLYTSNKISVYYLGTFSSVNKELLLSKTSLAFSGDASWPEWLKAKSEIELIYKAPVRSIYFVFSPFPWDVKKTKHLIGMFDAFLYMYLSFLVLINIKVIWRDPALRIVLILLLSYLIVFGFGVGNFGTGIRHRLKFAFLFILLAAPLIKRIIFIKNVRE
jgi:hypothetical protein